MTNVSTKTVAFVAIVGSGCYVGHPDPAQEGVGGSIAASDDAGDDEGDPGDGGTAGDDAADDGVGEGSDDGDGDGDGPGDGPGDDADDNGADDGADDGNDGVPNDDGPEPPPELPLAADIALTSVQLNQGVVTGFVDDGAVLAENQRNADVIAGRPTLLRGFWELAPGFSPRELEGRILVDNGGTVEAFSDVRLVDGPPETSLLDGGFLWELPADVLQPESTIAFEIVEPDGVGGVGPEGGARVPAEGFADVGVAAGDHVLSLVVVPLGYGNLTPDLSAANKATLEAALYDQNPATVLDIEYHPVVDYPYAVNNGSQLGDILGFLGNLKQQEGAGPEVYYAGVINVGCFVVGCGNAGTTGIAYIPGANEFSSLQRVSANVWYQAESSSQTVVHETGHNQGLNHVACPFASSSNTDPAYPYQGGEIGGWGWGGSTGEIAGSDSYDYMSYCGPSWVSDWTWNKVENRIATLSSWAGQGPAPEGGGFLLGHRYADGSETWFELGGAAPLPEANAATAGSVTFVVDGEAVASRPAVSGLLSEGQGEWYAVDIPEDARDFESIVADVGERSSTIQDTVVRFHGFQL